MRTCVKLEPPRKPGREKNRALKTEGRQKVVYVLSNRAQVPVPVETGLVNDQFTEVVGQTTLREGDKLVINTAGTNQIRTGLFVGAPAGGGR